MLKLDTEAEGLTGPDALDYISSELERLNNYTALALELENRVIEIMNENQEEA